MTAITKHIVLTRNICICNGRSPHITGKSNISRLGVSLYFSDSHKTCFKKVFLTGWKHHLSPASTAVLCSYIFPGCCFIEEVSSYTKYTPSVFLPITGLNRTAHKYVFDYCCYTCSSLIEQ